MTTAILPSKFDRGDLTIWLREYDACAEANGWNADAKIKKFPAFLRGEAASHFYALDEETRKTYAAVTKALKEAMCPSACKEVYYAEFEARLLKSGEDPTVYKWELEQILSKAEPDLDAGAKAALLTRQFMKGLPIFRHFPSILQALFFYSSGTFLLFFRRFSSISSRAFLLFFRHLPCILQALSFYSSDDFLLFFRRFSSILQALFFYSSGAFLLFFRHFPSGSSNAFLLFFRRINSDDFLLFFFL